MKKIFAIAFAAIAVAAMAKDINVGEIVEIDDINYKILSLDPALAEVTVSPYAAGELAILTEFTHYGKTFKVNKIGNLAFWIEGTYENKAIKGTLTIPEGIEEIGFQAFITCNRIDSISLPSTLKSIGQAAFFCYDDKPSTLKAVRCAAVVPPTCGEMVFGSRFNAHEGNDRNIPLWVPLSSVEAYRAEKQWDWFNIITDGEVASVVDEQHYNPDPDADENQGLDNTSVNVKAQKRIVNGQLVIIRGEKMFDATGKEL